MDKENVMSVIYLKSEGIVLNKIMYNTILRLRVIYKCLVLFKLVKDLGSDFEIWFLLICILFKFGR